MEMSKDIYQATVLRVLPLRRFIVRLADGRKLVAVVSPRIKNAEISQGDVVRITISPYDLNSCRIVP